MKRFARSSAIEKPAADNLAVPAIAVAPSNFVERLTDMAMRFPHSKAAVPTREPKTASKIDCLEKIIHENIIRNEMK